MASTRIGTWNLAGRWTPEHATFLDSARCDVWLLTEVSEKVALPGYQLHRGQELMAPRRHWAAILTTHQVVAGPDPHPASALAVVNGITFCSSILPWRSCGREHPWVGQRHSEKTAAAVEALVPALEGHEDLVWGGDWNHAMTGPEYAGSIAGRSSIRQAAESLGLDVTTAALPHRLGGLLSIDHLALGRTLTGTDAKRLAAGSPGVWLSDHDAYVVTAHH